MSQSSAALNSPNPMKKKVITALIAVAIGHIGVLWAVNHIKPAELKPIDKKPLQVRFVKIQEQPKPLPPKPKEPPKKPEPKKEVKEVKVVEKPVTPKETVKTEPKVETKVVTTTTTVTEKVVEKPKPVVQEAPKAQPAPDPSPKRVSIGGSGVQWSRSPRLTVSSKDLQGEARSVMVLIEADEKGKIINVRVTRSSGISSLDDKVVRAVRGAKFKPYMENGVAYPIRAEQPFDLTP
ncbi:TPA: TonB family protein [Acinetobacter baumannii]|uniref:energy transducer TonB n=2 Tax=Acinetobacter baumannii TaxID=470 RepID=UPI0003F4CB92|nr:energy transducer TonB [Acinetobacter baumannii]MDC4524191.1 TonB family protein [Acinetobacter baumannii]MDC4556343.1 TonB family protein [Acinetobacter baumannii]MDC4919664.1 TonB family protein [Acinetobacter baumannii]MDC4934106.1 TonB family protein [Acinetobacter baumannii]HBN5966650.1 TonB family protein [Acinetobacter baumannii]